MTKVLEISRNINMSHHCPESLRDGVEVLENPDYVLVTVKEKGQF